MRPDKYLRIAAAMRRENMGITSGFATAAQRCPDRPGLVDELGTLTWREIDQRCDAFAAALQALPGGQPQVIGIMCRNHRGFVEALVAANRIGADVLLLNTSFAGPGAGRGGCTAKAPTPSSTTRSSPRPWTARWPTDPTPPGSSRGPTSRRRDELDRREDDRRARRPRAAARDAKKPKDDPADLGHHRNTQGRQALRR